MVVGYYKKVYCALDIDTEKVIKYLINLLNQSDIVCDCKEDKYTAIMDNLDQWLYFYLIECYPEITHSTECVTNQVRDYLSINLYNKL